MAENTVRLSTALAGRYRIERHLGEGGMATVYLAEDLRHDRKVAMKVLRPELAAMLGADRFVQEIKTTANLQHPHILPLFDSGEADSFLYYVMPFVDGETLRDRLNREKQLSVDEAVRMAITVADALDYAHRQGVIHRDIKPENILLHDGRPMVADFGIALAVSAAAGGRMTETGLSLGTPDYMSPEQATADRDLTNRSDIYSLGAMLYEMLAGDPPHTGSSAQQVIMKIVTEEARPVTTLRKSVPGNVAAAVAKSLEKLPADRFESAEVFAEALANPAFALPPTAPAPVAVSRTHGPWNRLTVMMTAICVLLGSVAVWALSRRAPTQPVAWYSVALPTGEAMFSEGPRLAVSPDGTRLVYVGGGEESPRLYLRPLDELHAAPLQGTDGATAPFFSPAGTHVAFYARGDGAWRTVPLDGGPPASIADAGTGVRGGAWGTDGYLYFNSTLPGVGLVRVREGGGEPEPVTTIDPAEREIAHFWPEALPSARGLLFTVARGTLTPTEWEIAVADLETGAHTVLVRGVRARYAETGHLVYVTAAGTLMAAPFDEKGLRLTGDPVPIADGVGIGNVGAVDLTLSATGTAFYTTGGVLTGDMQLVWVTRGGTVEPIDPDWTGNFSVPTLSPDGQRLAVTITGDDGAHVWIRPLNQGGGALSRLTFAGTDNRRATWTPNGESVVFGSDRQHDLDLYIRRADGGGEAVVLLDDSLPIGGATYSRDGMWLVYEAGRNIYARRVGLDSAPVAVAATEFNEFAPALSPDGRWLAYVSNELSRVRDRHWVYVRPFPNISDGRWLVGRGIEPVWAGSGRELFYKGTDSLSLMAVEILPGSTFATGERRPLFPYRSYRTRAQYQEYDVSPDGQRFVMVRYLAADAETELIVIENFFEELRKRVGNE